MPSSTIACRLYTPSLNASVRVRLAQGARVLFEQTGRHAGLEAQGDLARLLNA